MAKRTAGAAEPADDLCELISSAPELCGLNPLTLATDPQLCWLVCSRQTIIYNRPEKIQQGMKLFFIRRLRIHSYNLLQKSGRKSDLVRSCGDYLSYQFLGNNETCLIVDSVVAMLYALNHASKSGFPRSRKTRRW